MRPRTGRGCEEHGTSYLKGCEGCRAYQRERAKLSPSYRARRRRKKVPYQQIAGQPADLTLEQYRAVAPSVVLTLVAEFGEAGALRVLNGDGKSKRPAPAPADPATVPPAGARAWPGAHGRARGDRAMREVSVP